MLCYNKDIGDVTVDISTPTAVKQIFLCCFSYIS